MNWRSPQADSRRRYLERYKPEEVAAYDKLVGQLSDADRQAYLVDLKRAFSFYEGMNVLDAGAGTGTLCSLLQSLPGLSLTALEPSVAMITRLQSNPELKEVSVVEGFCDAAADCELFGKGEFDLIASRQLANGLYDPLIAFRNWHHWLADDGAVVLIDGLYDRSAWVGDWAEEVNELPLSACQSTAMIPYLLEQAGFQVEAVEPMAEVNRQPATRTSRYVVVARKAISG